MRCFRCEGLMVKEEVFTRQGGILMARCLHCGDLIDLTVIINRGIAYFPIRAPKLAERVAKLG